MSKVFKLILSTAREMWTERNKHRHDKHKPSPMQADYIEMEREMKQIWNYKGKILETDERFFPADLDSHLENSVSYLRKWLRRWKPVIKESYRKATTIDKSQTKMIQFVLRPNPKPKYKKVTRPKPTPPTARTQLRLTQRRIPGFDHNGVVSTAKIPDNIQPRHLRLLQQTHLDDLWGDRPT